MLYDPAINNCEETGRTTISSQTLHDPRIYKLFSSYYFNSRILNVNIIASGILIESLGTSGVCS